MDEPLPLTERERALWFKAHDLRVERDVLESIVKWYKDPANAERIKQDPGRRARTGMRELKQYRKHSVPEYQRFEPVYKYHLICIAEHYCGHGESNLPGRVYARFEEAEDAEEILESFKISGVDKHWEVQPIPPHVTPKVTDAEFHKDANATFELAKKHGMVAIVNDKGEVRSHISLGGRGCFACAGKGKFEIEDSRYSGETVDCATCYGTGME